MQVLARHTHMPCSVFKPPPRSTATQFLKAVGAFGPPRRVIRSHVVAAKGGKVLSSVVKISPEPSVKTATATALGNKQ